MRSAGQALYKDVRGAQGAGLGLPAEKKAHYEERLVGPPPRHAASYNYIRRRARLKFRNVVIGHGNFKKGAQMCENK